MSKIEHPLSHIDRVRQALAMADAGYETQVSLEEAEALLVAHDRLRLRANQERMWCKSCGTVTRERQCDCTTFPENAHLQKLVNYADELLQANERLRAANEKLAKLRRRALAKSG